MLYDKIVLALIDLKKAIKEKFGDDGKNKRGDPNYTSGPLGLDRIQYEISRVSAAIRHTTGGGGESVDAVKFPDMVEPDTMYANSKEEQKRPRDYSIINKFKTLGEMVGDPRWGDEATVKFTMGSNFSNESLSLESLDTITLYSEAAPDVISVKLGSLSLSGTTNNISLMGLSIFGTTTYGANGDSVVAQNCNFIGPINGVPSGLEPLGDLVRSWEKCRFEEDVTLTGTAVVEYGFYDCWCYKKADGTYPSIILNNPNGTLILDGTTSLKMHIVVLQGNVKVNVRVASLNVAGEGDVDMVIGKVCDPDDELILRPITLTSTGRYALGMETHQRIGSTYGGQFVTSGIGSLQVRDNDTREGVTPFINPNDGTGRIPGVDPANTDKDWLNGICKAIVNLQGASAGIADGGISDDHTQVNFYPDKINKGDQYALFQLPLSLFGIYTADETTIRMINGVFSLILDSGPLADALNALQPKETGKGLSEVNFTSNLAGKLGAIEDIRQVTQANGLKLIGNTLSMDTFEARSIVDLSASCNGSLLVFPGTFTHSVVAMVYLNGLKLSKGKNYTITDTALTLTTTPPATGSVLEVELF